MPPSENHSDEPFTALIERLNQDTRRSEVASTMAARVLKNLDPLDDLADDHVAEIVSHLTDPDPRVRSHIVIVVRHIVLTADRFDLVEPLVNCIDDEDWRVRLSVLNPMYLDAIADELLSEDPSHTELLERLAGHLVNTLDGSDPAVRKRAGEVLAGRERDDRGADLFLHHPDPREATAVLVSALSDPVAGVTSKAVRGRSTRRTASAILVSLAEERPEFVAPHVDRLTDYLDTGDETMQRRVSDVLVGISDHVNGDLDDRS